VTAFPADRSYAEALDAEDQLAQFRDRFVHDDPALIYLDGNSLGPLPVRTQARIADVVDQEWGVGLVRSCQHWVGLPREAGDMLGEHLLGAASGQVLVCDSTTVNLYKLALAALDAQPGRDVILTDDDNFPTDRYVLEGVAAQRGCELRIIHTDVDGGVDTGTLARALDGRVALVLLSHVAYRSGALADMMALSRLAHEAGALVLWDLCHSAGSVPVELDAAGADLAVGCTYKYINAGPGAPAYLYVRQELQERLRQPIWGWFGQADQFAMAGEYRQVDGIERFLVGTPPVLGGYAALEGAKLTAEAGIEPIAAKARLLTGYLVELADAWLAPLGFRLASPREADRRGAHVTLHHPQAWQVCQALKAQLVIPDFRTPDRLRLGVAPLYTTFADLYRSMDRLRTLVAAGAHEPYPADRSRVT
jgi:kynureninase